MRVIDTRHEQTAVFAAEGLDRTFCADKPALVNILTDSTVTYSRSAILV